MYIPEPTTGLLNLGLLLISGLKAKSQGNISFTSKLDRQRTLSTTHSPTRHWKISFLLSSQIMSQHNSYYFLVICVPNRLTLYFFPKCIKAHSLLNNFTHAGLSIWSILPSFNLFIFIRRKDVYPSASHLVITFLWKPWMVF